ncbi:hypothetical protein FB451DRAFT_1164951 [Mycena latifolia]|nr:hypothetical protein FB451DRAFT_1164951 [Mycena latifolia]
MHGAAIALLLTLLFVFTLSLAGASGSACIPCTLSFASPPTLSSDRSARVPPAGHVKAYGANNGVSLAEPPACSLLHTRRSHKTPRSGRIPLFSAAGLHLGPCRPLRFVYLKISLLSQRALHPVNVQIRPSLLGDLLCSGHVARCARPPLVRNIARTSEVALHRGRRRVVLREYPADTVEDQSRCTPSDPSFLICVCVQLSRCSFHHLAFYAAPKVPWLIPGTSTYIARRRPKPRAKLLVCASASAVALRDLVLVGTNLGVHDPGRFLAEFRCYLGSVSLLELMANCYAAVRTRVASYKVKVRLESHTFRDISNLPQVAMGCDDQFIS